MKRRKFRMKKKEREILEDILGRFCVICEKPIKEDGFYYESNGRYVCEECAYDIAEDYSTSCADTANAQRRESEADENL
jgi:hypothetical protein